MEDDRPHAPAEPGRAEERERTRDLGRERGSDQGQSQSELSAHVPENEIGG
jgi:hypothetical protein